MQRWHQLAKVGVLIAFSGFEFRSSARLRGAEGGAGPEFFFAMGEGGKFPQGVKGEVPPELNENIRYVCPDLRYFVPFCA